MERFVAIAAVTILLVGVLTALVDDRDVESSVASGEVVTETDTPSPSEDTPSPAAGSPTTTQSPTATQAPTATPSPATPATPSPTPAVTAPEPTLPAATAVDPGSVEQLGPGRYEIALLRGIRFTFSIPEGQTYDIFPIPETASGDNVGVGLVQPTDGGVSGVAIYTAYGVGAVRDGASVVEPFDDVPASWSTFTNFTVSPMPAEPTLGGEEFAVISWDATLDGAESVPGRGPRVDLWAFDRAEDGSPQFTFADDGDVGSSWFSLRPPVGGEGQVAFIADAFASGSVDAVPDQHDELRRSIALEG